MGFLARLSRMVRRNTRRQARPRTLRPALPRRYGFEQMEPRLLLDATPIQVGVVYIEEDIGSDAHGDTFLVSFEGGAPDSQLTQLVIDGDQAVPGFGVGDVFFDTEPSGLGADKSLALSVVDFSNPAVQPVARVHVEDGTSLLVIDLNQFYAGDRLTFTLDVDEVEDFDPTETDATLINDGFDPITSGVEFQGSMLTAHFSSPHYYDVSETAEFRNRYDDQFQGRGLDLPEDNEGGKRDRTAGAAVSMLQKPIPVSIAGTVYHDRDNDGMRDTGEEGIAGVSVRITPVDTIASQAAVTVATDSQGNYHATGLAPGWYTITESQPVGYFDGLDRAGTVGQVTVGIADNPGDRIHDIFLGGGQAGIDYDFGEILPASLRGHIYLSDEDGNCYGSGIVPVPLAGVQVTLLDAQGNTVAEQTTNQQGEYAFIDLKPGAYTIVESTPDGLIDGGERVGTIDGVLAGKLLDDRVEQIELGSGQHGIEYDFCEHPPAALSGFVYHDENNNARFDPGEQPIANVDVTLFDAGGGTVATATTDGLGAYAFSDLHAGNYSLVEAQPGGWIDGLDTAGTVDGVTVGVASSSGDRIDQVQLGWGDSGIDFDFGELRPVSIRGNVYHDRLNDGTRDANDEGIQGVRIDIIPVMTARPQSPVSVLTDASGAYAATGLVPGTYRIEESQPDHYLDGIDVVGTVDGVSVGVVANPGDAIGGVRLRSGQHGVGYNFGEYQRGSIQGSVYLSEGPCFAPGTVYEPLPQVEITLLDATGALVETTHTNAMGRYTFNQLLPGSYTIVEHTPSYLLDGGERVGEVNGVVSGIIQADDVIANIDLGSGGRGAGYDFCEHPPGTISGHVFHDEDGNGLREDGEEPIAGVEILLRDESGQVVSETTTNDEGQYVFTRLSAGTYQLEEVQPNGWLDGGDTAGTIEGVTVGTAQNPGDRITDIDLGWGDKGVDYDFGEMLASSIAGTVHLDLNENCIQDNGEVGLAGIEIELLGDTGDVVATTRTNDQGDYHFDVTVPGVYAVREAPPEGYFHGGARPGGKANGKIVGNHLIDSIHIASGRHLQDYDFCEIPPATISGYVFQDGAPIITLDGQLPKDLSLIRDGKHTPDDAPLANVVLQLRSGLSGDILSENATLPGIYTGDIPTVVTDENGYYEFTGLHGGSSFHFSVYEDQPEIRGLLDGIDTAGTTTGVAINENEPLIGVNITQLAKHPNSDAILRISVSTGLSSEKNNFSEVRVQTPGIVDPPDPVPEPPAKPIPLNPPQPTLEVPPPPLVGRDLLDTSQPTQVPPFTWHLSVIDGGLPRNARATNVYDPPEWISATFLEKTRWSATRLLGARWTMLDSISGDAERRQIDFGIPGSIPVVGDFNGDGLCEVGVFYQGEWFLDLNGNGEWDSEDLWAQLGTEFDSPVIGDWDGDGKDDIGVFGPEWSGDPRALRVDPGLPDVANRPPSKPKNMPPEPEEATNGRRLLRLKAHGPRRADVIDHVFRFGEGADFPVTGDWNGDGIHTIGVFRDGFWRLDTDGDGRWTDRDETVHFGQKGDLPIVGDFDGDGVEEIGVVRRGMWHLDTNGNRELDAHDEVFALGGSESIPVAGDWNGDGVDEPGVYREIGYPTSTPAEP